jgi:hypothetical protein
MRDLPYLLFLGGLVLLGGLVGFLLGRWWSLVGLLALGLAVWVPFGFRGDGDIPGWFLGLITAGPVALGAAMGVAFQRSRVGNRPGRSQSG